MEHDLGDGDDGLTSLTAAFSYCDWCVHFGRVMQLLDGNSYGVARATPAVE